MALKSFVEVASDSHFPLENLPYGVFRPLEDGDSRPCVAIGDYVLDLSVIASAGLFDGPILSDSQCFHQPSLNMFLGMGRSAWKEARSTIQKLLSAEEPKLRDNASLREKSLLPMNKVQMLLPATIRDYTDFFSSMHHAKNCGIIFRGPESPIPLNWFHLPIAYHGRASSIVISGTEIIRPRGQGPPVGNSPPYFGPSRKLDFELEMAAVIGPGNDLGKPVDVNNAEDHIFGLVLMNDWSARDIQAWEYVPLGPFLGKSFGTTISPWIVTLDALEPFACDAPKQEPHPLPYLAEKKSKSYNIPLEVHIKPAGQKHSSVVTRSNFNHLYWTLTQQVAHHTINGCNLRPGDLLGTGTISGPDPSSFGCLLELTWNGQKPLSLNGSVRNFLEDGDEVTFTACCKLLSAVNCWLKCMLLDPYNQTDHPECKSRPDSGLSAITELDPGYITGPLSSVWKEWLKWCIEFGIEANAILAAPYDWRLSPSMLEERDLYFHKLKLTFETALKLRGGPSLVIAHSMGNNVFRYFLEWLKLEIAPKMYSKWLDEHIHAYFAIGAPLLGAIQTVEATLSGFTFGLPVAEGTARLMYNSFGSSLWMMPFSKHCRSDNIHWKHFFEGRGTVDKSYHCEDAEFQKNYSGWPTNIVNIEVPTFRGADVYPPIPEVVEGTPSSKECGIPTQLSFSAREVSDGTFFKSIEDYDPDSKRLLYQLQKLYHGDPVLNPLTPWDRPPIKNIFCIYGIDRKTEVGYYFAPSGKPYPDNWIITDVIYEFEGTLISRSGNSVSGNPGASSGDETVPYNSLSWCKTWLGSKVNITRAPQSEHDGSDVQVNLNVEHHHNVDIVPNMTRAPRVKYITYYEDSESVPGTRTAVWELDKANHRNIARLPVLMREMWLQIWHDIHPNAKSKFATKAMRGPLRDQDCYWDYGRARCAWPEHCEYRYVFGDVHLGQSCRLKHSPADLLEQYL